MLRIDKSAKKLVLLTKSALADAEHWERHLQEMICAEPDAFLEELGEESLLVIGQEVRPSDTVPDRIDILALDEDGTAVVIELKRGTHKLHLLQALSYAAWVSRWATDRYVETLAANSKQSMEDARTAIEEHVDPNVSVNSAQRILLIAENFDPAVLIATEWLHEKFGVDVRCYQMRLSQENGTDYLTCTCIYPPLEIATLTRGGERGPTVTRAPSWTDWPTAFESVDNAEERQFFTAELEHKQENRIRYRDLIYRIAGKRRYWVSCRTDYAYVRQGGRFPGDEAFWKGLISKPTSVGKRHGKSGASLRFHLVTSADFNAFKQALEGQLKTAAFSAEQDDDPSEQDE